MKFCNRCKKPLTIFSGYIPKIGELCKTCYDKALLENEKKETDNPK